LISASTSFVDTTTNNYNSYFYRIIPTNALGEGLPSIILNGTLSIPPLRVADLNGTDNSGSVDLVWSEAEIKKSRELSEDPVLGYIIQRNIVANETTLHDGLSNDVFERFMKNDNTMTPVSGGQTTTGGAPSHGSDQSHGGQMLNITSAVNITRMVIKVGVGLANNFNTEPDIAGAIFTSDGKLISRTIFPRIHMAGDMGVWHDGDDDNHNFVNFAFSPPVELQVGEYAFVWSSLNAQTCNSASCGLGNADTGDFKFFFDHTNNGDADGYAIGDIQGGGIDIGASKLGIGGVTNRTNDYALAIYAEDPNWVTIGTNLGATNLTFTDSSSPIAPDFKAYRIIAFNNAGLSEVPTLLHNPQGTLLGQHGNTTEFFAKDSQGRYTAGGADDISNPKRGLNVGEVLTFAVAPPSLPDQVSGLVITQEMNNNATLDWNDASGADNYQVLRKVNTTESEVNTNSTWSWRAFRSGSVGIDATCSAFSSGSGATGGIVLRNTDSGSDANCNFWKFFPRDFINNTRIQFSYTLTHIFGTQFTTRTLVGTENDPQANRFDDRPPNTIGYGTVVPNWVGGISNDGVNLRGSIDVNSVAITSVQTTDEFVDLQSQWNTADSDYISLVFQTDDNSLATSRPDLKIFWINVTDFDTLEQKAFYNFSGVTTVTERGGTCDSGDPSSCGFGRFDSGTTIVTTETFEEIGTPITSDFEDSTLPITGVSTYKVRGNNTDGFGLNSTEVDFGLIQEIDGITDIGGGLFTGSLNATALNSTAIKLTWDQATTEHPTDPLTGVIIQRDSPLINGTWEFREGNFNAGGTDPNCTFTTSGGSDGGILFGQTGSTVNADLCFIWKKLPTSFINNTTVKIDWTGFITPFLQNPAETRVFYANNNFIDRTSISTIGTGGGLIGSELDNVLEKSNDPSGWTRIIDTYTPLATEFDIDTGLEFTYLIVGVDDITEISDNPTTRVHTINITDTVTGEQKAFWNFSASVKTTENTGNCLLATLDCDYGLIDVGSFETTATNSSGFFTIATVDELDTMFTDTRLLESTTYTYRAKGQSAVSTGAFGDNNTATTLAVVLPDQVTGLVITQEMNNNATLDWDDALNADNYQVLRLENFSSGFEVNVNGTWSYREQEINSNPVFSPLCGFADIGTDANGFVEMSGDSGFSNRMGECYIFKTFPRAFLNGSQIQLNYDFSNVQGFNSAVATVDTRNEPNQLQRNDESEWAESSARNFANSDVNKINDESLILNGGRETITLITSQSQWNTVDTDYASIIIETNDGSTLGQDGTVKVFWINITDFTTGAPKGFYNFSAGTEVGEPEICADGQDCRRGTFGAGTTVITDQIFEVIGTPVTSDFEDSTIPIQGVSTYKVRGNGTNGFGLNSTEVDFGLIQQIQNLNATALNSTAVKLSWNLAVTDHPTDPLTGVIIQRSATNVTPDFFDNFTTDMGWISNNTARAVLDTTSGTINITDITTSPDHDSKISLNINDLLSGGWDQTKWTLRGKVILNTSGGDSAYFTLLGVHEFDQAEMSGTLLKAECVNNDGLPAPDRDQGCLNLLGTASDWRLGMKNDTDDASGYTNSNLNITGVPPVVGTAYYPEIIFDGDFLRATVYSDASYQTVLGCTNDKFDSSSGNCVFTTRATIGQALTNKGVSTLLNLDSSVRWSNLNYLWYGQASSGLGSSGTGTQGSHHEVSFFNGVNMTEHGGFITIATVDDLDTMFTDNGLVVDTDYTYRVKGESAVSTGSFSENNTATTFSALNVTQSEIDFVTVTEQTVLISPPFPITTLIGSTVGNTCEISWSAPPDGGSVITKYQIFRSVDANPYSLLLNKTVIGHIDTGLINNVLYEYNITALNAFGDSEPSNIVDCMPVINDVPSTPNPLIAVEEPSGDVTLTWVEPNNGDPTGYQIQRKIENGGFLILVNDTATTSLTFLDTATDPAVEYTWRVAGWNSLGLGAFTTPVTLLMASPANAPVLTAQQVVNVITINWTAPASDNPINGYKIEKRINFGSLFTLVANTTTTSLSFVDSNVTKPDTFGYRVRALSISGEGTVSNIVDVVFGSHLIVEVREQDGSGFKGGGIVRGINSTMSLPVGLNTGSDAIFDNLDVGNYNFTFFDDDNFILNKTFNFPAPAGNDTSTFTINALVFDVDCPDNGVGTDIRIKVNYTTAKDITEFPSVPVCDSTDQVSWTTRWQGEAVNDTSTMIADFISTVFRANAKQFLVSADIIPTIFNSGENQIESEVYTVNMTDVTINFNLFLGRAPSGGGGGGGGDPTRSVSIVQLELEQRLTGLSVLSRTHPFAQAGDIIEGSITVEWEGEEALSVKSIDVGEFSNIIRFASAPFEIEQFIEGSGEFAMSSGSIPYIITLPPFICDENMGITQNCVDAELISIPAEFIFESAGVDYIASTTVMVDLRPIPLDIVQIQIILLGAVLIISAVGGNFIRKSIKGARSGKRSQSSKKKRFKKKFDSS